MYRLIITIYLLMPTSLHGWTSDTKFHKYGSDCSDKDIGCELDTVYLFCENYEKSIDARMGLIDWKRASSDDYCRFKYRNEADDWTSGWRRSRLYRLCKTELDVKQSKAYQCWDYEIDPEYLAFQENLETEKKKAYAEWQEIYKDKLKVLLEEVEPLLSSLNADLTSAERNEVELVGAQQKLEQDKKIATDKLRIFETQYPQLDQMITYQFEHLDQKIRNLNQNIIMLNQQLSKINSDKNHLINEGLDVDPKKSLTQYDELVEKPSHEFCSKSTNRSLMDTRFAYSFTDNMFESIENDLLNMNFPEAALEGTSLVQKRLTDFREKLNQRSYVFDNRLDRSLDVRQFCKSVQDGYKLIFLNMKREELGKIYRHDDLSYALEHAINQAVEKESARRLAQSLVMEMRGFHARVYRSIVVDYKISESIRLVDQAEIAYLRLSSLTNDGTQIETNVGQKEIDQIFSEIRTLKESRLSVPASRRILLNRVEEFELLLDEVTFQVGRQHPMKSVWGHILQKIELDLGSNLRRKISSPSVRTIEDLIGIESQLEKFKVETKEFLKILG